LVLALEQSGNRVGPDEPAGPSQKDKHAAIMSRRRVEPSERPHAPYEQLDDLTCRSLNRGSKRLARHKLMRSASPCKAAAARSGQVALLISGRPVARPLGRHIPKAV